jgi:Tfp pilus assembly protein PilZ
VAEGSPVGFRRIPLIARGSITRADEALEALVCNLSVLGVYVTCAVVPREGERVRLRFVPPDGQGPIDCEAEVTWSNPSPPERVDSLPPGFGLRFARMAPGDRERIEALIEDYRESESPLIARPVPRSGFTRIPYVQPCTLLTENGATRGVVCNLSTLGVYVAVDPIPLFESRVTVSFRLPQMSDVVVLECDVAWVNPDEPMEVESLPTGCGLGFRELPVELRLRIERLVDDYLKIPRDLGV